MIKNLNEQYVTDNKGHKTAVILPVQKYTELLEDLHDLKVIAERKDEPSLTTAELKARLKKNGTI